MTRTRGWWLVLLSISCSLLVACAPAALPGAAPSPQSGRAITLAPSPVTTDVYRVDAWVSDKTPARDARVLLSANLTRNHIFLGGIMMRAYWPDSGQPAGSPNCYVMVLYQRGRCYIDVSQFPTGEYVPVVVTFEYKGMTFSGETGFTPR